MLAFDFDDFDKRLDEIGEAYDATPKQLKMATNRSLKRTAGTLRKLSSSGLKTELGLRNATALRRRMKQYRVGKGKDALKLWYGVNDMPVSAFKGRPKMVPGGVKMGETMIHGAFFARIGGKRKVMQRYGAGRWTIGEATMPVADRMVQFLEDNVFVDVDTIFFKHFNHEIRAATILEIGEYGK